MSLFDEFRRAVFGERTAWRDQGLRRPIADLERRHGGSKAAADAIGVSRGTLWRWKANKAKPSPANAARIRSARREGQGAPEPRRRFAGSTGVDTGGLTVEGFDRYDGRDRTLRLGQMLPEGRAARLAAAWEAGASDQELRDDLKDMLAEAGYPRHMADTLEDPTITF